MSKLYFVTENPDENGTVHLGLSDYYHPDEHHSATYHNTLEEAARTLLHDVNCDSDVTASSAQIEQAARIAGW
jgi:hypothetical protein